MHRRQFPPLSSPTPTNATLRSNVTSTTTQFWPFGKKKGGEWGESSANDFSSMAAMAAMQKQRYLTLAHVDSGMETVRILPPTLAAAEHLAREWLRLPPDEPMRMTVPVDYISLTAARLVQGPYLDISTDDTYQLAQTAHGIRLEIHLKEAAEPPPEEAPPPPPPPVLEMPATFNLELAPGRTVALDTFCESDDLDMSRTEDGTLVDGNFWGVLKIVHNGDDHTMDFSGTRLGPSLSLPDNFLFDQKTLSRLVIAAKPTTAKCSLSIFSTKQTVCEIEVTVGKMWSLGASCPPPTTGDDHKLKWFMGVAPDMYRHPETLLKHMTSEMEVTSIYYEAMPDTSLMDPASYISPSNGYAMPYTEFIPHLSKVLNDIGLSINARTIFITNAISAFANHKNIAYRFMSPSRLEAAISLSVGSDPCIFTRIFLMWRGIGDDELDMFMNAGRTAKEAAEKNWKRVVGFDVENTDLDSFRIVETGIMECA